jgi:hypothetical protein
MYFEDFGREINRSRWWLECCLWYIIWDLRRFKIRNSNETDIISVTSGVRQKLRVNVGS